MTCAYCARPVDPLDASVYRGVVGWERKSSRPTRRSGSDIIMREPNGTYACGTCITQLQAGVSVSQERLI